MYHSLGNKNLQLNDRVIVCRADTPDCRLLPETSHTYNNCVMILYATIRYNEIVRLQVQDIRDDELYEDIAMMKTRTVLTVDTSVVFRAVAHVDTVQVIPT